MADRQATRDPSRRSFVKLLAAGAVGAAAGAKGNDLTTPMTTRAIQTTRTKAMSTAPTSIIHIEALGQPWSTLDPFLFCVHHLDAYPTGTEAMAPAASLAGRQLGQDFSGRDGWSMYHGDRVPGFPRHPHRGFETITVTRSGLVDHSDSLGATARYGNGDVQWMTAGRGIVHAEMFPLLATDAPNPLELFQIWLNLPARAKLAPPSFRMLWGSDIPVLKHKDDQGRGTTVTVVAGAPGEKTPPAPPPDSWAADKASEVAIHVLRLEAQATTTVAPASAGLSRSLYFYRGDRLTVADETIEPRHRVDVRSDLGVTLRAGAEPCEVLLLQGRPIGEPVASYGPFVMNTQAEIRQAFTDYQSGGFGGWKWPSDAPVHPRSQARFAIHADGRRDVPS